MPCRAANARYCADRYHQRRAGTWSPFVPAGPVRAHLRELKKAGVGTRRIAALARVSPRWLLTLRRGKRPRLMRATAERILAVQPSLALGARLSAAATWRLIEALKRERYTVAQLAQQLGRKRPRLSLGKVAVRLRTALRVRRLTRRLLEGEDDARLATD